METVNTTNPVKIDFESPYALTIDGELIRPHETFEVLNPATNQILAFAPKGSTEHMEAAIAAARRAFKPWSMKNWAERGRYLGAYADALEAHKDELITLLTLEQGKPRHSMATEEVEGAIHWVRETAKLELPIERVEETDTHVAEVHRTPLGVVGAITPWNFPVFLGLWKVAPGLLAGNTMVMKPAPTTPLCTLRFGEIARAVFPAGVFNVVSGGNELGQQMTEHPDIAKISFTGSTVTGRRVMASAATTLKRLTLELGGNDAAIVLADADWEAIIPILFWGAFGNSGQWCIAIKRLYVHASIHRQFVEAFVAFARERTVGDGMRPGTDLGPIQNRMQFDKLRDLFEDVRLKGYKVPLGGVIDETLAGNFVPVTIIDNPPETSRVVQEEQFGPILPIIAFDDVEQAVTNANDSPYGLGGSVWSRDRQAALAVARRLETGTVWINELHTIGVNIPFGGHKQSGLGVESSRRGLEEFTNSKSYLVAK
jgi:acyl-CoA reductase-like NAD-dependent aldehyde dehydrogenase